MSDTAVNTAETTTQPRTANIFVLEANGRQNIDVSEYGNLMFLFDHKNPRSSIWETESVANEICEALERCGYDPAIDYVCLTGTMIPLAIFIATVTAEYGRFRALLFDARERNYVFRELGEPLDA